MPVLSAPPAWAREGHAEAEPVRTLRLVKEA